MAKSFGYDVQAVFFDVPFEVCMERNRKRERTVNDEIMHKMNERLRPPSFKEGFSKITVVRVKGGTQPEPPSRLPPPTLIDVARRSLTRSANEGQIRAVAGTRRSAGLPQCAPPHMSKGENVHRGH